MQGFLQILTLIWLTLAFISGYAEEEKDITTFDPSKGAIVVKISNSCPPLLPCSNKKMLFARLDDAGSLISTELYASTLVVKDHYYLLGVEPGLYAPIVASYGRGSGVSISSGNASAGMHRIFDENVFFNSALIEQMLVEAKPGELSISGTFKIKIKGRGGIVPGKSKAFLKKGDAVQIHYAKLIDPEMASRGATAGIKFYFGEAKSVNVSDADKNKILKKAQKHLKKSDWAALFK